MQGCMGKRGLLVEDCSRRVSVGSKGRAERGRVRIRPHLSSHRRSLPCVFRGVGRGDAPSAADDHHRHDYRRAAARARAHVGHPGRLAHRERPERDRHARRRRRFDARRHRHGQARTRSRQSCVHVLHPSFHRAWGRLRARHSAHIRPHCGTHLVRRDDGSLHGELPADRNGGKSRVHPGLGHGDTAAG